MILGHGEITLPCSPERRTQMSDSSKMNLPEEGPARGDVAPVDRVPVKEKIAYGLGTTNDMWGNWLLPSMVWPVFNMFLLVSPALISLALLINRLVDSASDPIFGWLSDNSRSRFGRRRPFILVGSILAGIALPLFFLFLQPGWSEQAYFWYLVVGSGIFITIVSCFNMPYQSLGAELTPDYNERTSVFAFKSGIQKLPEIGLFGAAAFVTMEVFNDVQTGEPNILLGAKIYSLILGVLMIVVGVIVFLGVKERYYAKVVEREQSKVGILETLGGALRCRPFRAQLAMALSYGMGTSMVGALGYYTSVYYVCQGDVALGSKWNLAMGGSAVVIGLLGIPFYSYLARRYGKRPAMMVVQVSAVAAFAGTWVFYNPEYPALQLIASGLNSFTAAGFWMLYGSIGADVMDYDELESGKRREGAFSACGSYLMKIGLAIGLGGSGVVLQWTGFDAALGGDQAPETLDQIRLYLAGIPIIGLVLAFVSLLFFGLTRERSEEIRAELEARRGTIE